jgi:hypothetical protein
MKETGGGEELSKTSSSKSGNLQMLLIRLTILLKKAFLGAKKLENYFHNLFLVMQQLKAP